jgi:hypothetical protein
LKICRLLNAPENLKQNTRAVVGVAGKGNVKTQKLLMQAKDFWVDDAREVMSDLIGRGVFMESLSNLLVIDERIRVSKQ